jgi:hypothetical protein
MIAPAESSAQDPVTRAELQARERTSRGDTR